MANRLWMLYLQPISHPPGLSIYPKPGRTSPEKTISERIHTITAGFQNRL
jgi:hypothetical protein